jgi:hypothetical protein
LIQWEGKGPETTTSQKNRELGKAQDEPRALQDGTWKHIVSFQDCVFRDNYVDSSMSFPGIIENTFNSELEVTNCLFQDNIYGDAENPATYGYAIRSFGPTTLDSTCLIDNVFLNHGPVLVYGAQYSVLNNYVESSQADLTCSFLALFTSQDDKAENTPTCEKSDASRCSFTQPPTVAPSEGPPSMAPSLKSQSDTAPENLAIPPTSEQEKINSISSAASSLSLRTEFGVCLLSLLGLYLLAINL